MSHAIIQEIDDIQRQMLELGNRLSNLRSVVVQDGLASIEIDRRKLFTINQLADHLGVRRETIYRYFERGLPRLERPIRIEWGAYLDWVEAAKHE